MPDIKVKVTVEGFDKLLAKVQGEQLYQAPWRRMYQQVTKFAHGRAEVRAPYKSGDTRGSIKSQVAPDPVPLWSFVKQGTKQGAILNYGGRGKRSRFRSGGKRAALTKGWLGGIARLKSMKDTVRKEMEGVKQAVERRWGS